MHRGDFYTNEEPKTFENIEDTLAEKCRELFTILDQHTITANGKYHPIYLGCGKPYPARKELNKLLDEIRQLSNGV